MAENRKGPLAGLRVVEMAGIGPAPFAAMLLADMGADVVRIDRQVASGLGVPRPDRFNFAGRGRRSVALDLKRPEGIDCALELIDKADALVEGFRPGVMERLGLGPDVCHARNPRLVFGRLTGWGQQGPLAQAAGHDLNYIALTGALDAIGRRGQPPTPPLNLLGDFAGGSLLMAFGIVSALLYAQRTGEGQVVDAAIVDGVSLLATPLMGLQAAGVWPGGRGENILDSGAPQYDVYRCADGGYVSIAPIEGKFQTVLLSAMGFDPAGFPDMNERANWDEARRLLAERFSQKTRAEWCALLEGTDACFAPVLSSAEASSHPHHAERGTFITVDGLVQPAPAPRFSGTPAAAPTPPEAPGQSGDAVLRDWGIAEERIAELTTTGVLGRRDKNAD
ncbi:CaiB/BaiF CoA-transferase family protein [Mesorhizobium sediminum]|uniref:CaiB/BaiF CoA transferase family protein n=1 Tax=Neoaquamicrobium sediminum TaxID=1849104 RepID=UPI0028AB3423|nr:CaiB/BaiF CoA-transferase family protein [Mesorhizobium sediminum]